MDPIKYWHIIDVASGNECHITQYEPKRGENVWTLCGRSFPFVGNPGEGEMTELNGTECMICQKEFRESEAEGDDLP